MKTKIILAIMVFLLVFVSTAFACDGYSRYTVQGTRYATYGSSFGCYRGAIPTYYQPYQPMVNVRAGYVYGGCAGCVPMYSAAPLVNLRYSAFAGFQGIQPVFGPSNLGSLNFDFRACNPFCG